MAFINDNAFDAGLNYVKNNVTHLYICSQEPATLAEATTTYALGVKAAPALTGPANASPSGRELLISAITDGTVNSNGDATHWALVSGTELLATNALAASQTVTSGNPFTMTETPVRFPDAASL